MAIKNLSTYEEDFWKQVYLAAVKQGHPLPENKADVALEYLRKRIAYRKEENYNH
jgi:hypothetical protein